MYEYSTSDPDLATANSEGTVTTHSGPGTFTVRAGMARGSGSNYDEAKVKQEPCCIARTMVYETVRGSGTNYDEAKVSSIGGKEPRRTK